GIVSSAGHTHDPEKEDRMSENHSTHTDPASPCNGDGGEKNDDINQGAEPVTAPEVDDEGWDWLRERVLAHADSQPGDRQAARDQAMAWLMLESGWSVNRLAAKLGWRKGRVREFLRFGRFCLFLRDPEAYRARFGNEGGGEKIDHTQRRTQARLA